MGTYNDQSTQICPVSAVPQSYWDPVNVLPVSLTSSRAEEWDVIAEGCGVSFRSAFSWLRGWAVRSRVRGRKTRLFEFHQNDHKIGQCAVDVGVHEFVVLDRLALKPGHEFLWARCMEALVTRLGSGRYRYGWELNFEQSRENEIRGIPGVRVLESRPIAVQVVEFDRWSSWEEYWSSTSSNTRRNAKSGEKANLTMSVRSGFRCLPNLMAINQLRAQMHARKGLGFETLRTLKCTVLDLIAAPKHFLTGLVTDDPTPLACFCGYEFGGITYYMAGGSQASNRGAAWYLQKCMLHRTWVRTKGTGKYIVGYVENPAQEEAVGDGLIRFRRAIKASDFETSIVSFMYAPALS